MKRKKLLAAGSALALAAIVGTTYRGVQASDHDDGETDLHSRALNLTDHYAFKSGNDLSLIMYVNGRSLPGRQYALSTNARYEFHVSEAASKTAVPTAAEDYVFRVEAGEMTAAGVQPLTVTVLQDGVVVGTDTGTSTSFADSSADDVTENTGSIEEFDISYFVGQRADSFYFDVVRFFEVRAFLASRFFGGTSGNGNASAGLPLNCRGDALLALAGETSPDADLVNLWNPPSCAPDFTKNLNVTAIAINVPISALGGGAIFDTWSTISVRE